MRHKTAAKGKTAAKERIAAMIEREYAYLRNEVTDLKNCQVTFLTFSIITTGAILGVLGGRLVSLSEHYSVILYLAPLTILIPSWTIFFDKAVSITRIVGYLRLLEEMLHSNCWTEYKGWERAMELFRKASDPGSKEEGAQAGGMSLIEYLQMSWKIVLLQTTQRYWVLVYHTFFLISALCIFLAFAASLTAHNSLGFSLTVAFTLISLLAARWNFRILFQLIRGKHRYSSLHSKWAEIHSCRDNPK